MSVPTLNKRVFRLSSGLVLLCALTILLNVWLSTIEHAKKQLANNLQVAQSVFTQVLQARERQLLSFAEVLTGDWGFKRAIGTQDSPTIDSVLQNHGSRIEADVMALLSIEGRVTNSTSAAVTTGAAFTYPELVEQALLEGGASKTLLLNGKVYQTLMLRVDVPGAPAVALLGFELDKQLLNLTKDITQLDATIEVRQSDTAMFQASTLPPQAMQNALANQSNEVSWLQLTLFSDSKYLSRAFLLSETSQDAIWIVLSEDVDRLFGEFNALQIKVTVIALLSVILAMILAAWVAKKMARPLHRLAAAARNITDGNYEQAIEVRANTQEIDELALSFNVMQGNIRERQEEIAYQASHDLLTDLQNRYKISEVIDQKFICGESFQVIGANILGFRGINDIFGYHNGDLCLQVIASRFKKLGGQSARLNGGEFLWMPDKNVGVSELKDIQHQLELPIIVEDVVMNIKMSLGVMQCPQDCVDTESVLRRVNISLDEARSAPGLIVNYQEEFEQRYTRRLSIISELKKALVANQSELTLAYQPKLNLKTGTVTHAEALIRWNSETLGFVPPDEFISIAEQAGLIGQVTDFVIRAAVKDAKTIIESGLDVCVAINLSAKDVLNPHLLNVIDRHLKSYQVPADRLSFEITESDLVSDPNKAVEELSRFRQAGFSLAIDDFGTGYSSLAYLKQLPVTELKIDKSFILKLVDQPSDQQIVQTILELAHTFKLGVIAEGVENKESLNLLKKWGCEWVQGYHVCRPIAVNDMISWCKNNTQTKWFD